MIFDKVMHIPVYSFIAFTAFYALIGFGVGAVWMWARRR